MSTHTRRFLETSRRILELLDPEPIERLALELAHLRARGGRLFVLGVGGSAANASHAVADLRKMAGIECYAAADNVAELTARTNDEGWATVFAEWLAVSRVGPDDVVLVLSVGGGDAERGVSENLVHAADAARAAGATVAAVVGRDGGHVARVADVCVLVPTVDGDLVTPQVEAFQSVVLHAVVSHPEVQASPFRWESMR